MSLDETITVGGNTYVISGIPFGSIPVWQMLSRDGEKLTGDQFMALPDADKDQLMAAVQKYVAKLNGQG
jgi:phage gpG-like protein